MSEFRSFTIGVWTYCVYLPFFFYGALQQAPSEPSSIFSIPLVTSLAMRWLMRLLKRVPLDQPDSR